MKFEILKPQSASGKGRRGIQEDVLFPAVGEGTIHDKFFMVSDGVGDNGSGFTAASQLCHTMSDFIFQNTCSDEPFTDELLGEALHECALALQTNCPDSEGACFALLYMHRHGCLAAHVGSARIYHIRPKQQAILYRSADDNRVFSPDADHVVMPVKATITDVAYGDYFVLLTKGAHSQLSEKELMDVLCSPVGDSEKIARLNQAVAGSPDNHSVTIVHVSGVMREALDEQLPSNERELMAGAAAQIPVGKTDTTGSDREHGKHQKAQKAKSQEAGTEVPPRQEPRRQDVSRNRHDDDDDDDRRSGGGFPVVLVTALLMVALAAIAWMCMRKSAHHNDEEVPAIEVKKDSAKKDTINIMKNEKPKPIDLGEAEKKKEETKQETPKPKVEEKVVEAPPTAPTMTVEENGAIDEPVVNDTPPVEEIKSAVEPIAPANPEQVTPRPVIPEDE